MVTTCCDDALLEFLELEANLGESQSLQQKEMQRRKRQIKITKIKKTKDIGHFLVKILIPAQARAKMF